MTFGTEFWAGIIGAIVGATVSGVVSFCIHRSVIKEARKERLEAKKEIEEVLAYSLMFKTMGIYSHNYHLSSHIEKCYSNVNESSRSEPCTFVMPFASKFDRINFTPEEMSFVLSLKNDKLTEMMMSLADIHNNLFATFAKYGSLREDFLNDTPAEMSGNIGTSDYTEEEMKLVRPKMVVMNLLIQDIRKMAKEDLEESQEAQELLRKAINSRLNLNIGIELKDEDSSKVEKVKNRKAAT